MTRTTHTPDLWNVADRGFWDVSVLDNSGGVVCHVSNKGEWFPQDDGSKKGRSHRKILDHARLIAAAPDMLDALKLVETDLAAYADGLYRKGPRMAVSYACARERLDVVRAAIAKAEGRA